MTIRQIKNPLLRKAAVVAVIPYAAILYLGGGIGDAVITLWKDLQSEVPPAWRGDPR